MSYMPLLTLMVPLAAGRQPQIHLLCRHYLGSSVQALEALAHFTDWLRRQQLLQ